jgi:hypothetical protein
MKDVLAMLRKTGRAVCLNDLVEDEVLGGVHKRRGLEHVLKRLKSMKLVERCAAPEDAAQRKGRPPAYYRATGEYGPGAFSTRSRACGVSSKSGGKKEIPSPGTDLKHTTSPEKGNVGKKNGETDSFSDERVFRQPRVVKNPSSASEVPISDKSHVLKVDDTWDAWD